MIKRSGSTGLATILGIGGLLAVGLGSFAAYKSYTGGCGACATKDAVATPVVLTEGAADACCAADKAAECATSEGCCEGKPAAECCKSGEAAAGCEEKAGCEDKTGCEDKAAECTGEKSEPTAAAEKGACPLCPSKAKG